MIVKLFWSERGEIACEKHAPLKGSDSWVAGRWRAMHKAARDGLRQVLGREPDCEGCRSFERVKAKARGLQ